LRLGDHESQYTILDGRLCSCRSTNWVRTVISVFDFASIPARLLRLLADRLCAGGFGFLKENRRPARRRGAEDGAGHPAYITCKAIFQEPPWPSFLPGFALSAATSIEVHNGQRAAGPMWYRVGEVSGSTITWGNSYEYDSGFNPTVALFGTTAVEVHNGQGAAGPMWYRVGQVKGSTINWGNSHEFDSYGFNPSVALYGSTVVEVHNGQATTGNLWHRVGQVSGKLVNWGNSFEYDSGWNPKVAFNGLSVLEVHSGQGTAGPLWYHWGYLTGPSRYTMDSDRQPLVLQRRTSPVHSVAQQRHRPTQPASGKQLRSVPPVIVLYKHAGHRL